MANNYYSLRKNSCLFVKLVHSVDIPRLGSYDHFCFFDHISQSTKKSDDFAFFIFFTFKSKYTSDLFVEKVLHSAIGWKRLIFADGPRQVINALTLFAIYLARRDDRTPWYDLKKYFLGNNLITTALTISTLFTVLIFAGSLLLLIIAAIGYVPLLCYIKGNLKVGLPHLCLVHADTFTIRNIAVTR